LVRGLDYYTKTVFEISHPKLGAQDALAAGGRYDKLVETFGGSPAGAVGFAVGVERLIMCMNADAEAADARRDSIFIATLGEKALLEGFKLVSRLREQGVAAEMDLAPKSLKSQMRYADKQRAARVVVLGDNEIQSGQCKVKDMKSGVETPCTLSELVKGKFDA
jgi:histidyl-tRNA synthetase